MGLQKWFISVCCVFPLEPMACIYKLPRKIMVRRGSDNFICKTGRAGNNSAGAGVGEKDFDFARADHFLKESILFRCIKK